MQVPFNPRLNDRSVAGGRCLPPAGHFGLPGARRRGGRLCGWLGRLPPGHLRTRFQVCS